MDKGTFVVRHLLLKDLSKSLSAGDVRAHACSCLLASNSERNETFKNEFLIIGSSWLAVQMRCGEMLPLCLRLWSVASQRIKGAELGVSWMMSGMCEVLQ